MGYSGNQQYSSLTIRTISAPLRKSSALLSSDMRIRDEVGEGRPNKTRLSAPGYNFSIGAPRNFSSRELVNLRGHADAFRVQGSLEQLRSAPGRRTRNEEMPAKEIGCALLADRHLGLVEGVRGLLETEFEAVVVVGDEVSLFESVRQLHVALAVVDLSLRRGDGLGLIRRIRSHFPQLKLIALSVHDGKECGVRGD